MDSWTPRYISSKKVIVSFGLVWFALSIPIFYLLYVNNADFKKRYEATLLEQTGGAIISGLLSDFPLSLREMNPEWIQEKKAELKKTLITHNVLKLRDDQLENMASLFGDKKMTTPHSLVQNFYLPLIAMVANYSSLVLDPDVDSYYFMDILVFRLPKIYYFLSTAKEEGDLQKIILTRIKPLTLEIENALGIIFRERKDLLAGKAGVPEGKEHVRSLREEIEAQIIDDKKVSRNQLIEKVKGVERVAGLELKNILSKRGQELKKDKNLVLVLTLAFWLVGVAWGFFLFVKILENVDELKKQWVCQKKQLVESEKLSFVGEIASAIAHEVKSPLSVIDLEASSLIRNMKSPQFDKKRSFLRLEKIAEMSHRIDKISNFITIFSRKSENDPLEVVSFKKIMEDTLYLTQLKSTRAGVSVQVEPMDCHVLCRIFQLEQVFINLVSNALDAIERLNERWVRITPSLEKRGREEWIVVKITDSGKGIEKEVADKMFDNFFTTKKVGKGTGIGLFITRKIIEDHHGRLYYDGTSPNTTFVVEIPVAPS